MKSRVKISKTFRAILLLPVAAMAIAVALTMLAVPLGFGLGWISDAADVVISLERRLASNDGAGDEFAWAAALNAFLTLVILGVVLMWEVMAPIVKLVRTIFRALAGQKAPFRGLVLGPPTFRIVLYPGVMFALSVGLVRFAV